MKNLFVTDFDGTLTRRDFFWLVVDAFTPAHLEEYWRGYRDGRLSHFEALAGIFAGIRGTEAEMEQLLERAEPDPKLRASVEELHEAGWEVVVASAGCEWYIRRILARSGVDLPVFANPGEFIPEQGLLMRLPTPSRFFSPTVGIDKAAIVRQGLDQGRIVAFAGDGVTDLAAARLVEARYRFARADLARVLAREGLPAQPFERWSEIARALVTSSPAR
jgi:HAD superfamily phosphoserine phosphatase-like hydrolase